MNAKITNFMLLKKKNVNDKTNKSSKSYFDTFPNTYKYS